MRIPRPNKKKLIIVSGLVVLALLITLPFIYVYGFNGNLFGWTAKTSTNTVDESVDLNKPTDDQKEAGDRIKEEAVNEKPGSNNSDTPREPVQEPGSTKSRVDTSITAASRNGDVFQIRTLISTLDSGTCTLTLTKDGTNIVKTAGTQPLSNTSTCKGFDIPISELSSGSWQVGLTYENNSLIGTASKVVVVE